MYIYTLFLHRYAWIVDYQSKDTSTHEDKIVRKVSSKKQYKYDNRQKHIEPKKLRAFKGCGLFIYLQCNSIYYIMLTLFSCSALLSPLTYEKIRQ